MSIPQSGPRWDRVGYAILIVLVYVITTIVVSMKFGFMAPGYYLVPTCVLLMLFNSKASGAPNSLGLDALNGLFYSIALTIITVVLSLIGLALSHFNIDIVVNQT